MAAQKTCFISARATTLLKVSGERLSPITSAASGSPIGFPASPIMLAAMKIAL